MRASVNGRPYSSGNAADLYWSFGQMISYASRGTRVQTGDVIGSGTVGTGCILELSTVHSEDEYPWLVARGRGAPGGRPSRRDHGHGSPSPSRCIP